ncbi:MAG: ComF family protein [Candidatus Puniceispirillales bacterium]
MDLAHLMINALIPPVCPLCQRGLLEPGLCADCFGGLVLLNDPCCQRCALPFDHDAGNRLCGNCLKSPPGFDEAVAGLRYTDTARQLILAFKHGDRLDIAPLLARVMLPRAMPLISKADLVLPVPLHRWRFFRRRFNQSAELTRHLLAAGGFDAGLMATQVLLRHRNTPSQGKRSRNQRITNVRGAFRINPAFADRIRNRHVLLIDDVMTTGATLSSAARTLKRHGAETVAVCVTARVC